MRIKWSLLCAILLAVISFSSVDARNVVVPTYYGYGVINSSAVAVRPYISACDPVMVPTYYGAAYYGNPYYQEAYYQAAYHNRAYYHRSYPLVQTCSTAPVVPAWNGMFWYYQSGYNLAASSCNLNIRSAPYVSSKKKSSNIIGLLKGGEQAYILGQTGNWYYVQSVHAPLRRGYVSGSYLRFYNNALTTPAYTVYNPATYIRTACW